MQDESAYARWLQESSASPPSVLVVLTHHASNGLRFYDRGNTLIKSTDVARTFGQPSLAIIDACGTAEPGASEFIRKLNEKGVAAAIATSATVEARMAGTFLSVLLDTLRKNRNDPSYTISRARFDAVKSLSTETDEAGEPFGPRALVFMLAGNGSLRACMP